MPIRTRTRREDASRSWIPRSLIVALAALAGSTVAVGARADGVPTASVASASETASSAGYAPGGAAACIECHDETEEHPVLSIFKTPHATIADPKAPFASKNACQSCHGPSAAHVDNPDDVPPPVRFGDAYPAAAQNEACLQCHSGGARMNWGGSVHDARDVSCTSCHSLHTNQDAVLRTDLAPLSLARRDTQAQVCFTCHQEQRAEIQRLSSHPIRQGTVLCSDCHNPHGSPAEHQLKELTLNETCYSCHPEKRGPFLFEHTPVREDCSTCHTPHGSTQNALLNARQPFLCQECHLGTRHVSTNYDGSGVIAFGGSEEKILGQSCTNCHSEIHGSNHPSGVRWTR